MYHSSFTILFCFSLIHYISTNRRAHQLFCHNFKEFCVKVKDFLNCQPSRVVVKQQPAAAKAKPGPVPITVPGRKFYGATYLFDRIGEATGVTDDLKTCFPDSYCQILSIVYYLILEGKNPLSRFPHWAALHRHPHGDIIPSQQISDLFASITMVKTKTVNTCRRSIWRYCSVSNPIFLSITENCPVTFLTSKH